MVLIMVIMLTTVIYHIQIKTEKTTIGEEVVFSATLFSLKEGNFTVS